MRHSPCQGRVIWDFSANQNACFAAGTPIKLPDGSSKPIEEFQIGDAILTKPEHEPDAAPRAGLVVALFKRPAPIINLHVGAGIVETTNEHPFYVRGFGWKNAVELRAGDELMTSTGDWIRCDGIAESGRVGTVYNVEVGDCHTYFVGDVLWGFDLWAHNYSWKSGRQDFWKAEAKRHAASGKYSSANLIRMSDGKAARIKVEMQNRKTGQIVIKDVPMELHHRALSQRSGGAERHRGWNLQPATPWGHESMDKFRHVGWDLIRIINGTNSF